MGVRQGRRLPEGGGSGLGRGWLRVRVRARGLHGLLGVCMGCSWCCQGVRGAVGLVAVRLPGYMRTWDSGKAPCGDMT